MQIVTLMPRLTTRVTISLLYMLNVTRTARSGTRVTFCTCSAACGTTAMHRGGPLAWTNSAWSSSSGPPTGLPYATSAHGSAAAFIFGNPLRAGDPSNPANKILWIVRLPRDGSALVIRAKPLHATAPVVTVTRPPDSSPGQIYPSYVNVPSPGCWRLTLKWAGQSDTLDLRWAA